MIATPTAAAPGASRAVGRVQNTGRAEMQPTVAKVRQTSCKGRTWTKALPASPAAARKAGRKVALGRPLALRATGGKLTTFDLDPKKVELARANFKKAGVDGIVTVIEGDAHKEFPKAVQGPIDMVFIDADKEGFLRSTRSLIQIMGRAARNINGRVILFADTMTKSMKEAIAETDRRRKIQAAFNKEHGIVPRSATRSEQIALGEATAEATLSEEAPKYGVVVPEEPREQQKLLETLKKQMFEAAARREFEQAAKLRDTIKAIQDDLLKR
jgi:16S rRNA C967 or C1407 C5-methylase (RsmB/RsmF family)